MLTMALTEFILLCYPGLKLFIGPPKYFFLSRHIVNIMNSIIPSRRGREVSRYNISTLLCIIRCQSGQSLHLFIIIGLQSCINVDTTNLSSSDYSPSYRWMATKGKGKEVISSHHSTYSQHNCWQDIKNGRLQYATV